MVFIKQKYISLHRYLLIENENRIQRVKIDSIIYFIYDDLCVKIHLEDGSILASTKTLKYYEELLSHRAFYRINKCTLMNMHFIKEYIKSTRKIILLDRSEFYLSCKNC